MSASQKPQVVMYGVVRDKDGNPKVDGDPRNLPPHIKAMLTDQDWQKLKDRG